VTKQCKHTLVHLLNVSKNNLVKQDVKKKINSIDNEIIDLYEKFRTNRLAKKPLTKKDKDKAMRIIKERQLLRSELSQMKD
jgi:transcriptional adapter 3